jgi:hypothetical protein
MFQGHNSFNKNCRCTFVLSSYAEDNILKVPKCEIFDQFFLTPINCAWVGNLRTGEKKFLGGRLRQIFAILCFLRTR